MKGCSWGRLKGTIRNEEETGKSKERTRRSKRAKKKGGGKDELFQCAVRYGRDGPVGWKRRQSRGGGETGNGETNEQEGEMKR